MTDKEIQELIDRELIVDPNDKKLYDKLYNDLSKEDPEWALSNDFKLSVLDQVAVRKRQLANERFWIMLGIAFFVLAACITLAITNAFGMFNTLNNLVGYAIIFGCLYFIFQLIEKRILKSTSTK